MFKCKFKFTFRFCRIYNISGVCGVFNLSIKFKYKIDVSEYMCCIQIRFSGSSSNSKSVLFNICHADIICKECSVCNVSNVCNVCNVYNVYNLSNVSNVNNA